MAKIRVDKGMRHALEALIRALEDEQRASEERLRELKARCGEARALQTPSASSAAKPKQQQPLLQQPTRNRRVHSM